MLIGAHFKNKCLLASQEHVQIILSPHQVLLFQRLKQTLTTSFVPNRKYETRWTLVY